MAHFYGVVEGSAKTSATRCGTKNSGVQVTAASRRGGAVQVQLYHVENSGEDRYEIMLIPWRGRGEHKHIASGTLEGWREMILRLYPD